MYSRQEMNMDKTIRVARKQCKADLVLKNVQLINVFSHEIYPTSIAVSEGMIAAVGDGYEGETEIDLNGKYVAPGFIDGHLHIESSMAPVQEFARTVVPHGTTTVIIDPHEIANVMGTTGITYMLKTSKYNPLNVYVMLPSCVPATPMETAGAELKALDLFPMLQDRWVLGLGEVMNFPGVLNREGDVLDKLKLSEGRIIDGHAPGVTGPDLNAYIAVGIKSDHECTNVEEAREKLRLGMHIMIREGSTTKNLAGLLPLVNQDNISQCFFVTDDRDPIELLELGHIDHMIRKAVSLGLDPISAIRMATINTAKYFGLKKVGAVAPGYDADLVVLDDLEKFKISQVYKNGECVGMDGKAVFEPASHSNIRLRGSVNVKWIEHEHLRIKATSNKFRVIDLVPGQIVTQSNVESDPKTEDGFLVSDPQRDLLKIVVIERHYGSGQMGIGVIRGFKLKKGAIASTIAHDSHNIICVGVNDADIYQACVQLVRQQGGLAIAVGGETVDSLPLPIAGLIANQSMEKTRSKLEDMVRISKELGSDLGNPFMTLSFMALPVIPKLKLTDKGLFDLSTFAFVDLFL